MAAKKQVKKKVDVSSIEKPSDVLPKKDEGSNDENTKPKSANTTKKTDNDSKKSEGKEDINKQSPVQDKVPEPKAEPKANPEEQTKQVEVADNPPDSVDKTITETESKADKDSKKQDKPKKEVEGFGVRPREDDEGESGIIPLERSNKRLYLFSIIIFVVVIGLTSSALYFRTQLTEDTQETLEEVVAEEEVVTEDFENAEVVEEEESTSSTALARDEMALEILNASGIAGLAASVSAEFEDLGYLIDSVGNSTAQDKSELFVKQSILDRAETLLEDVEDVLGITSAEELEDAESVDARIILGGE